MRSLWAVVALVVVVVAVGCTACNDVILDDSRCNGPVVSGRTMSFPVAFAPHITAAGPGSTMLLTEVAPGVKSTFGSAVTVKHGFVCMTNIPEPDILKRIGLPDPNDPFTQFKQHAFCIDGMNDKGLSVAMLYQRSTKRMAAYNSSTPGRPAAINFLDLAGVLLARHTSIAAVKADLATTQVVWNSAYDRFGRVIAFGATNVTPMHLTIHDASGASLVVQFNRNGRMEVLDNPGGVLANAPLLQEQIRNYNNFLKQQDYQDGIVPPHNRTYTHPGDYGSPARFARLRLMKTAAQSQCWAAEDSTGETLHLSPGFTPPGAPSSAGTLHTILGMLNTVHLSRGYDDAGGAGNPDPSSFEVTHYITLRDHSNNVFYYRTGNSLLFRSVTLGAVQWAKLKGEFSNKPLRAPAQFWAVDDTQDVIVV